ncbi:hypothetical protein CAPTEDRAFT_209759 [Capitella teleta]|uniref:VWFD domain-containing protein n=1 Tax=Capitella teleta TaxID=283909 RepID=R7TRP0_CAPTE|nr:hypothetical protein CAPTEDRAFT_209759 [Capitella teleta]|eukprot:ELT96247.1 hypothetical protein CAPTEDRAFT_209759 [Capitella teleta]
MFHCFHLVELKHPKPPFILILDLMKSNPIKSDCDVKLLSFNASLRLAQIAVTFMFQDIITDKSVYQDRRGIATAHDLHISNVCAYVLLTDDCFTRPDGSFVRTFFISAIFERVKNTKSVKSFVKEVLIEKIVKMKPKPFRLMQGLQVKYFNETIKDFPAVIDGHTFEIVPAVFAHPKDFSEGVTEVMSVTLPNGINVQYDGIKAVKIKNAGKKRRCGICGNSDGKRDKHDFIKGFNIRGKHRKGLKAPGPSHGKTTNMEHFVNSWFHMSTGSQECIAECQ